MSGAAVRLSDADLRIAYDAASRAVCDAVCDVRRYVSRSLADRFDALRSEVLRRGMATEDKLDHGGPYGMPFRFDGDYN